MIIVKHFQVFLQIFCEITSTPTLSGLELQWKSRGWGEGIDHAC